MFLLRNLLGNIQAELVQGGLDCPITGIHFDSRKIEQGFLFVCIPGFKVDGHNFIDQAILNGAVAVLVEKIIAAPAGITVVKVQDARRALAVLAGNYNRFPANNFRLIGVTGTNGKTTTTFLIETILKEKRKKVGLIGTVENHIGEQCLPVTHTTPESLELQRLFSLMKEAEVDYGVMEVSSHALDLGRVDGVEFDVGVFTNLTQDHLDYHPDMSDYLRAKSILFSRLGETNYKQGKKYGVVNGDDPYGKEIIARANVPVITFGIKANNDIWASNVEIKATGASFKVNSQMANFGLKLKITGFFSVYNALAAVTVGLQEKIEPEIIKKALEQLTGVAGRFESVVAGQDFSLIVDYAHTPDSLENILLTAKEFTLGRVITIFGCGGDRDRSKRPLMGEKAARYSDYCIITSDNPRTEEPGKIIEDILPGVKKYMDYASYQIIEDRREAIETAIKMTKAGDILIIAGKGHETYQIIKDKVILFDDRQVAKEVLRKIGYGKN